MIKNVRTARLLSCYIKTTNRNNLMKPNVTTKDNYTTSIRLQDTHDNVEVSCNKICVSCIVLDVRLIYL